MNEIEELCRQVVNFIPDNAPSSSTEFNRPSFAAKTTLLFAADEIARLTAENAELRERLEKAVILPFSHLETLKLLTCAAMCYAKIRELIVERMASSNDIKDLFVHIPLIQGTTLNFALNCLDKSNLNCNKIKGFEEVLNAMGDFKDYLAKAEARLAELKGGEQE